MLRVIGDFMRTVVAFLLLSVGIAHAYMPCPYTCRLGLGQPLFLSDSGALLINRCDRPADRLCVVERRDLDGKVLGKLPRVPSRTGRDKDFNEEFLKDHTVQLLEEIGAWDNVSRPFALDKKKTQQVLQLSLARSVLTCTVPGRPTVTRDFGCVPNAISIFGIPASAESTQHPIVAFADCKADGYQAAVVCQAGEIAKTAVEKSPSRN